MYRLLTKQFIRSRSTVIVTLLVLALGIISVLMGGQFLNKQQRAIDEVAHYQQEHIQQNAQWHAEGFGFFENGDRKITSQNDAEIGVLVQVKCDTTTSESCNFVKVPQK